MRGRGREGEVGSEREIDERERGERHEREREEREREPTVAYVESTKQACACAAVPQAGQSLMTKRISRDLVTG
jgi:hypothetical protein